MQGGAEIKIDIPKMRAVARVIESQSNIIRNCFDSIKRDALALRENDWEGANSDAYSDRMRKLCDEQSLSGTFTTGYVVKTLQEYVMKLNLAADEFVSTERILHARAEALPTNIFSI